MAAGNAVRVKTKEDYQNIFSRFDEDDNGILNFEKFKIAARFIGESMNDNDILEMLHSTHVNTKTSTNEGLISTNSTPSSQQKIVIFDFIELYFV